MCKVARPLPCSICSRQTPLGVRLALLVRAGIEALRERGWEAIIVLGHPSYYARFG